MPRKTLSTETYALRLYAGQLEKINQLLELEQLGSTPAGLIRELLQIGINEWENSQLHKWRLRAIERGAEKIPPYPDVAAERKPRKRVKK